MTAEEFYTAVGGSYSEAKTRLMNDRLITRFVGKYPADPSYQQLADAHAAGDAEAMFKAAHAMKGVCANLALTPLAETASTICEYYRPGCGTTAGIDIEALFVRLNELQENTLVQIAALIG